MCALMMQGYIEGGKGYKRIYAVLRGTVKIKDSIQSRWFNSFKFKKVTTDAESVDIAIHRYSYVQNVLLK